MSISPLGNGDVKLITSPKPEASFYYKWLYLYFVINNSSIPLFTSSLANGLGAAYIRAVFPGAVLAEKHYLF